MDLVWMDMLSNQKKADALKLDQAKCSSLLLELTFLVAKSMQKLLRWIKEKSKYFLLFLWTPEGLYYIFLDRVSLEVGKASVSINHF